MNDIKNRNCLGESTIAWSEGGFIPGQFLLASGFLAAAAVDGVPPSSCSFLTVFFSLVISFLMAITSCK